MIRNVFMRFPNGRAKAVTFSYDDGSVHDKRLAELFASYGLKATFNFNGSALGNCGYSDEEIASIFYDNGHEIATHGELHRANGNLRPIEGITETLNCRLDLERRCGRIIRGMAYPDTGITLFTGKSSYEQIKDYLCALGIVYARSLGADNNSFMLPTDFHNWIPSAHHNNPKLFDYIDEFLSLDISPTVYGARRASRLLYVWGHSYEFERDGNWDRAEEMCRRISGKEDIWYATNIEIYEYVEAFGRLLYSADGNTVYNPTLIDIFLDVDGRVISIGSGKTVKLEEP